MTSPVLTVPADTALAPHAFFAGLRAAFSEGSRLVTYYGRPTADGAEVRVTAILARGGALTALRTTLSKEHSHQAMSPEQPAMHIFERELHEQQGLRLHGHPWLKPVRAGAAYPFYALTGKEVHEVGVGPVHAGVIEPGHFRFMCLGETVHHLEIALGYQHRGVEALLLGGNPLALTPLIETVAGDSTIAHAWAHCAALEALAGLDPSPEAQASRALGLELERIAIHLATLAGLATDIAHLQGSSTYGRLRTTAINAAMRCCGSRFGRGWLRPGGVRAAVDRAAGAELAAQLKEMRQDLTLIGDHFLGSGSVQHRLKGVGVLAGPEARGLGVVGVTARASGVELDARADLPAPIYARFGARTVTEPTGDCWARAVVRIRELDASLAWLDAMLAAFPELPAGVQPVGALAASVLAVAVCEGVRGEVVHCLETDHRGALVHYKVQDPSLRNWFGLAMAVRGNEISDFPICNKSFDLSYCGNDL